MSARTALEKEFAGVVALALLRGWATLPAPGASKSYSQLNYEKYRKPHTPCQPPRLRHRYVDGFCFWCKQPKPGAQP